MRALPPGSQSLSSTSSCKRRAGAVACASVAVAAVVVTAAGAGPGWRGTRAPEGGPARAFAFTPDGRTAYAGTIAGVFVSRDGGPWRRGGDIPEPGELDYVLDVAAASNLVAYAAASGKVYKTTDDARPWRRARSGISRGFISDIAVAAGSPNVAYAWGTDGGVYRTDDAGTRGSSGAATEPAPRPSGSPSTRNRPT